MQKSAEYPPTDKYRTILAQFSPSNAKDTEKEDDTGQDIKRYEP